jgi:hypothetical protein
VLLNNLFRSLHFALYEIRLRRVFLLVCFCFITPSILAQDNGRFALEFEGGAVWQTRNDIRIPNETGTEFSLVDAAGKGPGGVFRAEAAYDLNEKHGFRMVVAPLEIDGTGTFDKNILFAGELFTPGSAVAANYKFSSYRFTYRYRFYDGSMWRWQVGFTGFIRDARIALQQGDTYAEDTDVGFVPLVHLRGEAQLSDRWRFMLDVDGLAAPQGRAFDIAAKMAVALSDRWDMAFGYRTIEGGADVEQVFNFAWLHFATASFRLHL